MLMLMLMLTIPTILTITQAMMDGGEELQHPHIVSYMGHDYIDSSL